MRRSIVLLTLLLSAPALVIMNGGAFAAVRCSKAPHQFHLKGPRDTYVLGTPGADTVLAGRGDVTYVTGDGHFGPGPDRPIFGQRFLVERIGTPASASLPGNVASVIVVPWDYAADCRPTPWSRSAQWLPQAERGLVFGQLREPAHWVQGIPTLDVHVPQAQPYPRAALRRTSPDSAITADEGFELMEALPEAARFQSALEESIESFRTWLAANPTIAQKYPAKDVIRGLVYNVETTLLKRIVPPVVGTYRLAAARPGQDSAIFFIRTYPRPSSAWNHTYAVSDPPLANFRTPAGYYLMVAAAASERELPTSQSNRAIRQEGYFALPTEPRERPDGSREWAGRIDVSWIDRELLGSVPFNHAFPASASRGTFVMDAEGRVHVEMDMGTLGGRPVILRGERISQVKIDSTW
jgi:hypothetical protein